MFAKQQQTRKMKVWTLFILFFIGILFRFSESRSLEDYSAEYKLSDDLQKYNGKTRDFFDDIIKQVEETDAGKLFDAFRMYNDELADIFEDESVEEEAVIAEDTHLYHEGADYVSVPRSERLRRKIPDPPKPDQRPEEELPECPFGKSPGTRKFTGNVYKGKKIRPLKRSKKRANKGSRSQIGSAVFKRTFGEVVYQWEWTCFWIDSEAKWTCYWGLYSSACG